MLIHPQFDPVAIAIGPLAIRWYGLMYLAGFLAFMFLGKRRALSQPWHNMRATDIDDLLFYGVLGVIAGGRLGQVLFYEPGYYLQHPLEVLAVWKGGMSFHGGFLGVLVAMALWGRKAGKSFFQVTDFIAPLVPLGLMTGRIGNFINGELWGRVASADLPWAMVFPAAGPEPRHPSQIYEALLEGVLLFLVLRWATHKRRWLARPGVVAGIFFAGYGLCRIFVETLREPDIYMPAFPMGVTMGMILSLPMVAFGAWLIRRGRVPGDRAP